MQVRLLGPVDVAQGGVSQPVRGLRRKAVLAVLALSCGEIVSTDRIADVIWGEAAPNTAVNTVQSHMSYLRQVLGSKAAILARGPGYVLDLGPDATDVQVAERLIREGTEAAEPADRARHLRAAVALWRGRPLADVAGVAWLEEQAERLDQLRLRASRALIEARMELGEHAQLVAELERLAADHPFDEQMHAQLMLALYRTGRQADALAAYDRLRHALGDDLGIDPTEALRDLHGGILRQDPALDLSSPGVTLAPVPPAPVPAQLPSAVPAFAGRGYELARLDSILPGAAGVAGDTPAAVVISAVSGTAGVGKTALAVHWAHRVAAQFPDGQLYVNLRGFDPGGLALNPAEAIRGLLDALAVPRDRIPAGLPAQAGLYRSLLAGQRVLVVLDNARDAEQVRPLLPGSPGCLALVTSRSQLLPLVTSEGAHHLTLDLLSAGEARDLLTRRLGADRMATDPDAAADIIARCAGLPLALAIAAARAVTQPGFPLAALAAELRASTAALDAFEHGDPATDVRAVFSWSYRMLSTGAARLFRLLGLPPGPDISLPAAASLAGIPPAQARTVLAELAQAHLLTEHVPGRYAFHDLLRAYAAEKAHGEAAPDSWPAARRLLDHYLHAGRAAAMIMNPVRAPAALSLPQAGVTLPQITDHQQALAWFAVERPVLLAIIGQAPASCDTYTWRLASDLTTFLDRQGHWHDLNAVHTAALAAATRLRDQAGLANVQRALGIAQRGLKQFDDARAHYQVALDLFAQLDDHVGQAQTHTGLAWISAAQGRSREALDHSRRGFEHFQAAGSSHGQAVALANIGWYHAELGEHHEALVCCQEGLALARELGNLNDQGHICDSLGYILFHLGHHRRAIRHYHEALELFRLTGDRHGEATSQAYLGDVHHALGEIGAARQAWQSGLEILDQLQLPAADQVRAKLSPPDDPSARPSFPYPSVAQPH